MTGQTGFHAALLDPSAPVPRGLTDGAGRAAGRRFAVYRNNVAVSLTEALIEGFPACHRLLGDDTFRGMAGAYLREHPPASPVMAQFGADLPAFLDAAPQLARMRWLADVARLEYGLRLSYHAADAVPLDGTALAAMAAEDLSASTFGLAPAMRLLRSDWPALSIWRKAMDPSAPQAANRPEDVLIARPDYDPEPHLLLPGDAAFVAALSDGAPLGQAAEQALTAQPDHDTTRILGLLLQTGSLTPPQPEATT